MRRLLYFLLTCLLSQPTLAQVTITIDSPLNGSTQNSLTIPLLYHISGAPAEKQATNLDHVHWTMPFMITSATAPNLDGVDQMTFPGDDEYTLQVWMATPDHQLIDQKAKVTFKVVTSGVHILAPSDGNKFESSDLTIFYEPWGDTTLFHYFHLQVDDGPVFVESDGDGQASLNTISDGAHLLKIWGTDSEHNQLKEISTVNFSVQSSLSQTNAKQALKLVKKIKSAASVKRKKLQKQLMAFLNLMGKGGKQSAAVAALNHSNISKAKSLAKKQSFVQLQKLLGKMT